jgi:hypothetical protein
VRSAQLGFGAALSQPQAQGPSVLTRKLCPFTPKPGANGGPKALARFTDLRMTNFSSGEIDFKLTHNPAANCDSARMQCFFGKNYAKFCVAGWDMLRLDGLEGHLSVRN